MAEAKAAKAINDERTQLIQEIFTALNRSRSGHLNADEMRPFGDQTGDLDWAEAGAKLRGSWRTTQPRSCSYEICVCVESQGTCWFLV